MTKANRFPKQTNKKNSRSKNKTASMQGNVAKQKDEVKKNKPIKKGSTVSKQVDKNDYVEIFPTQFPFWARLKISKNRTTLVIDEDFAKDKKGKMVEGYVHREATSSDNADYEKIDPNPDRDRTEPMYLKRPRKLPKYMFIPHNKTLDMPVDLFEKYDKNNKK